MVLAYRSVPMCSTGSNAGTFIQTCGAGGAHSGHTLLIVKVCLTDKLCKGHILNHLVWKVSFNYLLTLNGVVFGFQPQSKLFILTQTPV